MEEKTIYVKTLMERWKMNEADFIAFVARHLPRIIYEDLLFDYSSDCKICAYESTCPNRLEELNGGRFLCKGFLQPYQITRMRIQDPTGTAEIHEHPEDVFFRRDHVEQFEKVCVCPELSKAKSAKKAVGEEEQLRPDQRHRLACREVAKELWGKDPTITIAKMAYRDEINRLFDGKGYDDRTIRGWIKDLCPDRSPGRRKKT